MRNGPSSQPLGEREIMLADWLETPDDVSGELAALREALDASGLTPEPPTPDPEDAWRSSAELRALLDGLAGGPRASASTVVTFGPTRVGYVLDSDSDDATARVVPAFAYALGTRIVQSEPPGDLTSQFPDLWLVDLALWQALGKADARSHAAAWLRSPGRRLLRDLATLVPPGESTAKERAASLLACKRAAGLDEMPRDTSALAAWLDQGRPPRWRELHTAVPGLLMRYWQPHDGDVITAFRRLDRGSPCAMRGAALGWLLGRAAREPYYEVDGIRRDLRDDLPVRLAAALAPDHAAERSSGAALQAVLLQHASRIAHAGDQDAQVAERILTAWGLAQWMYKCLVRSPFYGSDEERLWAELHAHLGGAPMPASDPFDPARIGPLTPGPGSDGLDIDELAIVSGILCHFTGPGPHLDPVPLPVVHFLRRLAIRRLRPGEVNAEEAFVPPTEGTLPDTLGVPGNALGWPAAHLAPPWVARRFLTERRMPWLSRAAAPEVVDECLEHLARRPATYAWFGFTVHSEGHTLDAESRMRIAESWRALAHRRQTGERDVMDMPAHALAALAIGVLPMLTSEERTQALQLADLTSPEWRPFLLDAYAEAAARDDTAASTKDSLHLVWQRALDTLLQTVEDPQRPARERLQSAFLVLRRIASAADAGPILRRLALATSASPFREHAPLQREIRRLGLHTVSSSA